MFKASPTSASSSRTTQHSRLRMRPTNAVLSAVLLWSCCGCIVWAPAAVAEIGEASKAAASHLDGAGVAQLVTASASGDIAEEILQLPHALRHQQHFSHRIEQAVNDFKRAQLQQLGADTDNATNALLIHGTSTQQQKKTVEGPPLEMPEEEEHRRRHEQHHHQQPQHNMRHRNHHHETRKRHQHESKSAAAADDGELVTLNVTHALQTRFFDRDSLFRDARVPSALAAPTLLTRTTRGPHSRGHFGNELDAAARSDEQHEHAFGDSAASPLSSERFLLNLSASVADDDDNDEYSYEDSTAEDLEVELPRMDERAGSSAKTKVAVKRYTNPFTGFQSSAPQRFGPGDDYDEADYTNDGKQSEYDASRTNNNYNNNDDDDESPEESRESDSEAAYSSDKWNHIEEQHQLKQRQHQRELQRRVQQASGGSSTQQTAQRQTERDNDLQNIYSRNYIPGTLTRQKNDELGTLEAVQQTRRNHVLKHVQNKALANAHAKKIFSEGSCRLPQRRVERIQMDPTKIYTPHCTVLHRCADDTGCCKSDRQTCAPKRTKSVDLYFFVKSINDRRGSIERLTFVNHTECHCVDKAKQPAEYGAPPNTYGVGANVQLLRHATVLNCNCPRLYEKILQEDGFCRCDCSSGNTGCDWLKRGMEHFSMMDRKCISGGRCKPPTCAYGGYMKKHGRCSRREEQLSTALTGGAASLPTNSIRSRAYHLTAANGLQRGNRK